LYRQGVDLLAVDCQMKAVVAAIENTCVKSHWDERDNHGIRASKPTPKPRQVRR
jgi:hypothetical protein